MDIFQLFLLQLLAHILTDYTFQTDRKAADKNEKGFKSKFLKWHALIMFISAWLLSFQIYFVVGALLIALTHYIIDGFKPNLNRSAAFGRYAFFIDQGLHLVILGVIVYTYSIYFKLDTVFYLDINSTYLAMGIGYLICGKPANIVIKEIFKASKIEFEGMNKEDLPNAGRLIGIVERWLVLTFILIGQFSAVGFLIAAKSILRYKNEEKGINKSEYVLIGTLISFAIAIGIGILLGGLEFP
jgi:Flp pilus assembly pilin Flp